MSGKHAVAKLEVANGDQALPHSSLTRRLLWAAGLVLPGTGRSCGMALREREHPAPGLIIEHRKWRSARQFLLSTMIPDQGGVFGLLGEGGTGKTVLLRRLFDELRSIGERVELFKGADASLRKTSGSVLLIDDAALLDDGALAELAHPGKRRVILADQPAFAQRLPPSVATVTLLRLADEEASDFLSQFLRATTRRPLGLSAEAETHLVKRSNGIPRVLRNLTSGAVMLAETAGAEQIEVSHIRQAEILADRIDGALARVSVTGPKPPSIVSVESGTVSMTQSGVSSVVSLDTLAEAVPDLAPLPGDGRENALASPLGGRRDLRADDEYIAVR